MKRVRNVVMMLVLTLSMSIIAPVPGIWGLSWAITAEAASAKPKLNKTKVTIQRGKTYKLTLKNIKAGTKVKWSTSKKSVTTIKASDTSCVVTAKSAGTATVTAKIGKKSYKCKITVKNPPVMLSAKSQKVEVGKSFNLSLLYTKSNVKWSTSNKKVATIKKISKYKYLVTGKQAGTAIISAKLGKKSYKCKVTVVAKSAPKPTPKPSVPTKPSVPETESPINSVTPPQTEKSTETEKPVIPPQTEANPPETAPPYDYSNEYKISESKLSLNVGTSASLYIVNVSDGSLPLRPINWSSSDTGVAKVSNNGIVTGVSCGIAIITAEVQDVDFYACTVVVTEPQIEAYYLNKTNVTIAVGEYSYIGVCCEKNGKTFIADPHLCILKSSNTSVATITDYARIEAISEGTATISVYETRSGKSFTCKVTVTPRPPEPTAKYSYKFSILNPGNYTLYNKRTFGIYIQTENPDMWSLSRSVSPNAEFGSAMGEWDDVQDLGNSSFEGLRKVSGGYILFQNIQKSGTYTYSFKERVNDKDVDVGGITLTLHDYDADLKKWADHIVSTVTTSSMTDKEKVDAVCEYVARFRCYRPYIRDDGSYNYVYLFKYNGAPWEIKDKYHRYADCSEANYLLAQVISSGLGFKAEAFWLETRNHVNTRVWLDDGIYQIDGTSSGGSHFVRDCDLTPVL